MPSPSTFRSSSGATVLVAMLGFPQQNLDPWRAASDAGSGLPWWTPIVVSGVLLLASALYKFTHRPKPPQDIVQTFQTNESTSSKGSQEPDRTNFWKLLTE